MTHVYDLTVGLGAAIAPGSKPRLRWKIASSTPSWIQSEVQLELSSTYSQGTSDNGMTESVSLRTQESVDVHWPFIELLDVGAYEVRARVRTNKQDWTEWSDATSFHVTEGFGERGAVFIEHPAPHAEAQPFALRYDFQLPTDAVAARVIASAQGSYEITINGTQVGDQVLTGGWTVFDKRLITDEFDVRGSLHPGKNSIEVLIAGGWYTESYGHLGRTTRYYGQQPSFAMRLVATLVTGECVTVETSSEWECTFDSPVRASSIYQGEVVDARLIDDTTREWTSSRVREVTAALEMRMASPVRRTGELPVVAHWQTGTDSIMLDFGQNHAGRLRIKVRGERGHTITLNHAEVLDDGALATRPLRFAAASDTYILTGAPEGEVFEPRFTFHGYRYAEVIGWPGEFDPSNVVSVVLQSDLVTTGTFSSSHTMVNRLHENVVWSTRSNFLALPTDCPQRDERLGWTGDIQVFAPTSSFLYDDNAFLQSWLIDLKLEQQARGGRVPVIVPDPINDIATPAAAWGDAATIVPWTLYERFGDTSVLAAQFESMKSWVNTVRVRTTDNLWVGDFQFGDWLDPAAPPEEPAKAMTDPALVATAYLFRSASLTARTAEILEKWAEADHFQALANEVKHAFLAAYSDRESIKLSSDTPTAYSLAIVFGLVESEDQRQRFGNRLSELVRASGHVIQTGFVGTPIICDALTDTGHVSDAESLLLQTRNPSWLYPVTMGATTIWERWDSLLEDGSVNPGEMTSFNHYALGAVADWLHRRVGGLAPATPGYRMIKVEPLFLSDLNWAESTLETVYGRASSRWERSDDGTVMLEIEVPANTSARVTVPGGPEGETVGSGVHQWLVNSRQAVV